MAATSPISRIASGELVGDRRPALSAAWRAFWTSRLVVWAAGTAGLFVVGTSAYEETHAVFGDDPTDSLSGVLLSPADRWDAGWFLSIADAGYDRPDASATAFFPLYPLLVRVVGAPLGSLEAGGVIVSLCAFFVALYLLHRLTELELGRDAADGAVLVLAFFPTAFFFSAIYSESLFLALSVGCLYAARRGWWVRAALVGALAAATRSSGVLLVVPLAIMLVGEGGLLPRHRPTLRDAAVLLAVPLGVVAYMAYIRAATRFGALAPFKSQDAWAREFRGPLVGIWVGVKAGLRSARDVLWGTSLTEPVSAARSGLINFAALIFASAGVAGALRRLPLAYGAYALVGLAFIISFPANDQLKSLPRLALGLFPIFMWLGAVTAGWRYRTAAIAASAVGLAALSALFASGYWIA